MLQQICSYFKAVAPRKRDNMVILSPPIIFIISNLSIFVTFLCSWNTYGTEKQDHQYIKFAYIRHSEFSGLVHLYFSLEKPPMVLSVESQCKPWVDFGSCFLNRLWNPLQVSRLTNGNNYGIIYTKLHWYRCWFRFQSDVVMISITRYLTNWMVNAGCRRNSNHSPRTQTVDANGQGQSCHDGSTSARCTWRWVPDLGEGRQFGTL